MKEAPQITLVTAGQKPMPYKGKMSYIDIFEFINIYSETFVFGDQKEDEVSIASKPWLTEVLPELKAETADDICLKKEGLCVIYVTTFPPVEEVKNVMQTVAQNYDKQIDRGLQFNFMWLDAKAEADVFSTFKLEEDEGPLALVFIQTTRKQLVGTVILTGNIQHHNQEILNHALAQSVAGTATMYSCSHPVQNS